MLCDKLSLVESPILRVFIDPQLEGLVSGDKNINTCINRGAEWVSVNCLNSIRGVERADNIKCDFTLIQRAVFGKSLLHQDNQRFQVANETWAPKRLASCSQRCSLGLERNALSSMKITDI